MGAVDHAVVVVHGDDRTEVDEPELLVGLHHVVGLEVAVGESLSVEIAERRGDFDDVGDGLVGRQGRIARGADLLERVPAHVLHDDVADLDACRVVMLDEVVDPDDVRMFHLGQSEGFGLGSGHGVGVAGVHQSLEHDPAVVHVSVDGQVDPAESAVRDTSLHFVLAADEVTARQLGNKGVPGTAGRAESLGATGLSVASPPDGLPAIRAAAEPLPLRHLRIGEYRRRRIASRHRRYRDDSGTEASATAALRGGARSRSAGSLRRSHGRCRRRPLTGGSVSGAVPQMSQ